jgi:WD40 repeat protein
MKKKLFTVLTILLFLGFSASAADSRGIGVQEQTVPEMEVPQIVLEKKQICNVYSITYSPDGRYIAAGYSNGLIRIWNLQTGVMGRTFSGHSGPVWSVAYSPDGNMLVSGSADHTVKCWDMRSGKLIRTLTGHSGTVSFVTFNTNGAYIASGATDKTIKFWETSTGKLLQTITGHNNLIAAITYSSSGKFVASASWDKTIKIYYTLGAAEKFTLTGHTDAVFTVKFSPDEKTLVSGSADKTIRLWDVETGKNIKTFATLPGEVWEAAYSPDGKYIAGADSVGTLKIWDTETGKEVWNFVGHTTAIRSICFSKDGKYLYSGDFSGNIKVWDTKEGTLVATLLQCSDGGWVSWTPDGYLNGSEEALKELSYTVNGKKYSLDQIKETVFRPAILAARLTGTEVADTAAEPSLASIVFSTQPSVKLAVTNANGTARTDDKQRDVSVRVTVTDTGSGIGRVLVKLNGRSIQIADTVQTRIGETVTLGSGLPLTLRYGKNTISAAVYDGKNIQETTSSTIELNWEGRTEKPRLFVLAAAVDKYTDPNVPQLKNSVRQMQKALLRHVHSMQATYIPTYSLNCCLTEK